jgi:hypothetical protein
MTGEKINLVKVFAIGLATLIFANICSWLKLKEGKKLLFILVDGKIVSSNVFYRHC